MGFSVSSKGFSGDRNILDAVVIGRVGRRLRDIDFWLIRIQKWKLVLNTLEFFLVNFFFE